MQDLIGRTINKYYKVISSLGSGGMSEVYKVYDSRRRVHLAMKVLRQDIAQDPAFLKIFQLEGRVLANLSHPNIVRFYSLERSDELVFLLMEYIDGGSLQAEIARSNGRPITNVRIGQITEAVCKALHFAHDLNVVHCDIKPGNILIEKSGRIVLTDFGIARLAGAASSTLAKIGTPAYMAPEQVEGYNLTPQLDIYSLGIVLYEMLTGGKRPFTGKRATIAGTTTKKIRWEQVYLKPVSPRVYNRVITADMEAVVIRCLEKEPAKRFTSTIELQKAIHAPGPSKKPAGKKKKKKGSKKRKKKWGSMQWQIWAGAAALVLALVIFRPKPSNISPEATLESIPIIKPTIPMPTLAPTHTSLPTSISQDVLFIEIWNKSIDKRTTIDMTVCNWDSRDQGAIITIERPDGTQQDYMDLSDCCNLMDCSDGFLPAWKFYITPEDDELPGLWRLTVEGATTGRTASLVFNVDP